MSRDEKINGYTVQEFRVGSARYLVLQSEKNRVMFTVYRNPNASGIGMRALACCNLAGEKYLNIRPLDNGGNVISKTEVLEALDVAMFMREVNRWTEMEREEENWDLCDQELGAVGSQGIDDWEMV